MKLFLALAAPMVVLAQAKSPSFDSFYKVPSDIAAYPVGTAVGNRIRPVNTSLTLTTNAGNPLKQAYQIFYRTSSTGDVADGTVATVFVPVNAKLPAKILSYQTAEDSANLDCAPSWALVNGSASTNADTVKLEGSAVVGNALRQGYYVVVPDALGSKSGWLAGRTEGRACLDGIRATIKAFNLPRCTPTALYGYSGGAHITIWASSLAATYAPQLNITGASYGGAPVDLRTTFNSLNKGFGAWLAGAGLFGLANAYPSVNSYFTSKYNDLGRANATLFRTPGYCINNRAQDGVSKDYLGMFTEDILANGTVFSTVFDNESLLATSSELAVPAPKFPRYQYHGRNDEVVPFAPAQQYVNEQCGKGAQIAFEVLSGTHPEAGVNGINRALKFAFAALEGKLSKITCGQPWSSA
ncbi:lipase [Dissoconium aciculare CBS 342.82]|uniref:Lipase n=1 Tax=Dissoconium aciculare CBS 342.82 TaxID=1314786 RepID=A0A6J3MIR4_9PEZI|nr:lipase [Dissoconium aciculare CBS 342.82]KAF1827594.1 lipase [Dissoconium aciculare CBS 342.82]